MESSVTLREAIRLNKIPTAILVAAFGVVGLAFNLWPAANGWDKWGNDFNQFYSASGLVGTGHLYDWDALRKIELEHGVDEPSCRLPVVAYGFKVILGTLPYVLARSVWLAGSLAALLVFAAIWPETRPIPMLLALAWSMPAALLLLIGQDDPFWLMFFAAGLVLMKKKRHWSAGFAFSLCICKFHLALGIPVMLATQRRWKTLIAGAISGLVWIASSFAIEGPGWPSQYAKVSQPDFSPALERMPNLHGLASRFPWANATEMVCAAGILILLWWICRGNTSLGMSGAAAAACGLLVGRHAYAYDYALLIPLSILTIQHQIVPPWVKVWAMLMLSPVPVMLLTSEKSLLGQLLIAAFVVSAILVSRKKPMEQTAPAYLAVQNSLQAS